MQPYLSIVSGTYNRLPFLQRMMASARASLSPAYTHEFVVVDGGSTDGTLEWLRSQRDVRLIEHGELRGAIAAFNDGARSAHGRYVIMANDDVEFLPHSLTRAIAFMDNNPHCGVGAFYQDRGGRGWHVEAIGAIGADGKPTAVHYGQVCIIPKWLGDKLRWWELDGARTYGGDTVMSARSWEAGYPVLPISGAAIHDLTPLDELRQVNSAKQLGREHPDTAAYLRAYPRGPQIRATAVFPPPESFKPSRLRVFYAPLLEPGHATQKQQKRGLRDALAKYAIVHEFDYANVYRERGQAGMWRALQDEIGAFSPDLALFQAHNQDQITAQMVREMKRLAPAAVFVNWNGDVWEEGLTSDKALELARIFDLQLVVNQSVLPVYAAHNIPAAYWDIAWEPGIIALKPNGDTPAHDVLFMANCYSDERTQLGAKLRESASELGFDLGLYGSGWPDSLGDTLYNFERNGQIIRNARVVIGDQQWPDKPYTSDRLFNSLAAGGAMVMYQRFADCERYGLEDGRTCVLWNTADELPEMLAYWLDGRRDSKRKRVANAGRKLARERHSFDARVRELFLELLPRYTREK